MYKWLSKLSDTCSDVLIGLILITAVPICLIMCFNALSKTYDRNEIILQEDTTTGKTSKAVVPHQILTNKGPVDLISFKENDHNMIVLSTNIDTLNKEQIMEVIDAVVKDIIAYREDELSSSATSLDLHFTVRDKKDPSFVTEVYVLKYSAICGYTPTADLDNIDFSKKLSILH